MSLPEKCVVDTNVPKTANLAFSPLQDPDVPESCIAACIAAIEHVRDKRCLVIDAGDEIYGEYKRQLLMKGQPGVGDRFMKWVHDHRWSLPESQRVNITKNGDSYDEFPTSVDLASFDKADMKFVAVANAHEEKPPILQAVDHKWWGWKDALAEAGVTVQFLCPDYTEKKYAKKIR